LKSKELATIYRSVPLDLSIDSLHYTGYEAEQVGQIFEKFEFNSLMERVGYEKVNETDLVEEVNYTIVTDETKEQYESLLTDGGCLHVELDGENYHRSTIISFGLDHHDTVLYIP